MAGFPPDKPIKTITEKKRAEEEDDQNAPEEETQNSILNLREDTYSTPQQDFRYDYRPISVSGFPGSCSAINEGNKHPFSSSYSRIKSEYDNKLKEHVHKKDKFKERQEWERSQIQSSIDFLGFQGGTGISIQNPHPTSVTQPREEDYTLESIGFIEETDNSSLGLVQNSNPSSVTQPRQDNISLVDRNDQTVNQQIITPSHGSSATSHHQSSLNPHAPRNTYEQQQFTIPNHGSTSSARSDQNQPWRSQPVMGNQMMPMQNQMINPGHNFNHNISASNPVPHHFPGHETNQLNQMGMFPNQAQLMHQMYQPQERLMRPEMYYYPPQQQFMGPESNQLNQMGTVPNFVPNQVPMMHQPHQSMGPAGNYMTPETMQQNQMAPSGWPGSVVVDQNYYNQQQQHFGFPTDMTHQAFYPNAAAEGPDLNQQRQQLQPQRHQSRRYNGGTDRIMYYQQSGLEASALPDLVDEVAQRRFERAQQYLNRRSRQNRAPSGLQQRRFERNQQGFNARPSSDQKNLE